jgi:hypothetical protein
VPAAAVRYANRRVQRMVKPPKDLPDFVGA